MALRISLIQQIERHRDVTWDLSFSLDGKRIVSSDGEAIYLWKLYDNQLWDLDRSFPIHKAGKPCFTPDGTMIAFLFHEKSIRLITLDGKEVSTFPVFSRSTFALSPDQCWLVSGGEGHPIMLWDLHTFQSFAIASPFLGSQENLEESEMDWSDEVIEHICFTPDSQRLVLAVANGQGFGRVHVCHFDPVHKKLQRQTTLRYGSIDLALSPNGKLLATIDSQSTRGLIQAIYLYDMDSFQLLHSFPQEGQDCYGLLAFSPDNHYLISSKDNGIVDVFSVNPFERIASFDDHPDLVTYVTDPIEGLDWSSTGYIATGGAGAFEYDPLLDDNSIKIWKVEEEEIA